LRIVEWIPPLSVRKPRARDASHRRAHDSRRRRRADHGSHAGGRLPLGASTTLERLAAATPVGHVDGLALLGQEADIVVCPHPLDEIAVVGQAYDIFDPLDEWSVASLLADAAL
jgi:predicted phosphoribosyltransferase